MNHCQKKLIAAALAIAGWGAASAQNTADPLRSGFENPPESARPRVWWHWMSGNITEEEIVFLREALRKDRILGLKAAEERKAAESQGTDRESDKGDRHFLSDISHVPDVLLMVHADDHRTGAQEQQCLEERVRRQVEHRRRRAIQTYDHDHVTKL